MTTNAGRDRAAGIRPSLSISAIVDFVVLILLIIGLKISWTQLYTTAVRMNTWRRVGTFVFKAAAHLVLDYFLQTQFISILRSASETLQDHSHRYMECGAIFVAIYALCFIMTARTKIGFFKRFAWFDLVFDIGCLVEMKFGLFRKLIDGLARWRESHSMREA